MSFFSRNFKNDPTRTKVEEWQMTIPITPKEKAEGMNAKKLYDMNVWTMDFKDPLMQGVSPFPVEGHMDINYGIVLDHAFVSPGAITLGHEVGHWIGLLHIFDSGCENEGDGIAETIMYNMTDISLMTSCAPRIACDGSSFIPNNLMDYAGDDCATEPTPQQRALMRENMIKLRNLKPGPVFN
ncbi:hypothetical protein HGRIS_010795 [Hohenbuehelia grisea]|uniref:Peptidase M43 pregnancy-associated plasma-A domain-containing protein n=1 Tax=Hohenbuehelia grisea TaxID=104357 RepID=A0ABR3IXT3_9AGAR